MDRLSRLEEQARAVEKTISSRSNPSAALDATIRSTELYLQALRLADKPSDRTRLDARCKHLLAQAERLKTNRDTSTKSGLRKEPWELSKAPVSTRKLTTRENIILLESSKLNGFIFKPWATDPPPNEFSLQDREPFTDSRSLPLSPTQLASFDGWKRPQDALSSIRIHASDETPPSEIDMRFSDKMDLVQDMTSDCSVVASLCAGTSRVERGHPKVGSAMGSSFQSYSVNLPQLLPSIVYPYDHENDQISLSPNGKYVLKLYFNGCWRRVEIDDYLPTSKTTRVLHVIDRCHPGVLWPALIEKAYLKVRGGYDFPGSNSGTDLAVLTGWIPQQIFLHDEDVEPDRLWDEIVGNFHKGHLLITIGTGKLPRREQRFLGLAAEHDYAVLNICSKGDAREILVKNPWADGDVWRGAARRRSNQRDETALDEPTSTDDAMMPGTFWIDFNSVFQYFENMYLNWNPGLFSHRQDLHFSWQQFHPEPVASIIVDNPQFAITATGTGEVWLLLNRHFRTGDYTQATVGKNGYMSIYLYERHGNRVISSEGAKVRGPFVDSPNTLLRINATAQTTYTAVVVSQDMPLGKMNFTISAISRVPITLSEAQLQYPQEYSLQSAWTRSTAGGSSESANYLNNPQFRMNLTTKQRIALVLRIADRDGHGDGDGDGDPTSPPAQAQAPAPDNIHVKMLVVFSDGSRITRLRHRDVMAHSGDYRRRSAVVETELGSGKYTIICSTFDADQHAAFSLTLYSSSPPIPPSANANANANAIPALSQLPADGAGRLLIPSAPAVFTHETNRLLAPLHVSRMSRATFVARHEIGHRPGVSVSMSTGGSVNARGGVSMAAQSSLFKMTLEQGQGPYKQVLASSEMDGEGEFSAVASGLRVGEVHLHPSMSASATGGLWLVVERLAQGQGHGQGQGGQSNGGTGNGNGQGQGHDHGHGHGDGGSSDEALSVHVFTDERVELGPWGLGEG